MSTYSTTEYNNNLTSSYTDYSTPSNYNTLFAQKLPPTVPSMNFPVVLEQGNVHGYDALTHDGDGNQYYNVKSAYGTSCTPNFFVAKCPDNKFIRSFLPGPNETVSPSACPLENGLVSEGYASISGDMISIINSLGLIFFYDKNCEFSKKMYQEFISVMGSDNFHKSVQLRDVSIKSNEQELTNYGGYAVPFVVSTSTNNTVTGYMPLRQLVSTISKKNVSSDIQQVRDLNINVYVMENCEYCRKLKSMLDPFGSAITYLDGTDPANASSVAKAPGFPFIVSKKTGKNMVGLPSTIQQMVNTLS
jgi:glutaredoxin